MSVLAHDVLAAVPVDPSVQKTLELEYDFSGAYLDTRIDWWQTAIQRQLGRIGVALELDQADFDSPLAKLEHDSGEITDLFHKLGQTNPLRIENPNADMPGLDAGFEFAHMLRLVEADYAAIPDAEKRAEVRMTEGLLREELALLWRPRTPVDFYGQPEAGFMFDLDDPNVDGLAGLSLPDRWLRIGSQLSEEAAEVFEEIYTSPTVSVTEKLEARCRMVDMKTRSWRLQASMTEADRPKLYHQIDNLNVEFMREIDTVWNEPAPRGIRNGRLAELTMDARVRQRLMVAGDFNHLVRLAMPREDRQHESIPLLHNIWGTAVSLAVDVAEEDIDGNFVRGYQVKAKSEELLAKLEAKRQATGRRLVHYQGVVVERFDPPQPHD